MTKTSRRARIGLIGDYSPQVRAHVAIPRAIALAAGDEHSFEVEWLATENLGTGFEEQLATFDALWCVPASPYKNMDGALSAIRFAREHRVPFLGTCGGFQHTLIEYARNVLGMSEADHAESNPDSAMPIIAPLACSLVGAEGTVKLQNGSRVGDIYGGNETTENYHCNFGLDSQYLSLFDGSALHFTGFDSEGGARIVELEGHPFFIATLFQPELSALTGSVHPLVAAYVQAAFDRD